MPEPSTNPPRATEPKRELERRARQQEVIAAVGERALDADSATLDEFMHTTTRLVAETLDADYCKVLDLDAETRELRLRQGVGWSDGIVGSATVAADENSQAGYTLLTEAPVIVSDLASETRFSGPELLTSHDVTSGISTIIGSLYEPWGILGVHDTERRRFTEQDVNFVQSVANVLASAITRVDRMEKLERYETVIESITDGVYVLDENYRFSLVNEAYVEMTGYSREELLGEHCALVVGEDVSTEAAGRSLALQVDGDGHETIEAEIERPDGTTLPAESRFTTIPTRTGTFHGTVGVVRDVRDRKERERQLEKQRERLAALDELNGVVREVIDSIIDQSTRTEIENAVCERLAETESYLFAWVGEIDPQTQQVVARAEAGTGSYLDEISISIDAEAQEGCGPTGRAFRTKTIQTTQDINDDAAYEPWADTASRYGFRSSAAIPITHEETLYGVLNVYAERSYAFENEEMEVIGQLGESIGHAIAAIERKQALMSDDSFELDVVISDAFESLGIDTESDVTIQIEQTLALDDDEFLVAGTTTESAVSVLESLAETRPEWEQLRLAVDETGVVHFDVLLSEPPLLSVIASVGGSVQRATLKDGDYTMTIQHPRNADIRRVMETIQQEYPQAVSIAHRRATTRADGITHPECRWASELTDRQRMVLETAHHMGFFEWPRRADGQCVADVLGISPATFSQHLRAAERKVFESLLARRNRSVEDE